jgi:hypothetical protein
MVKQPERNFPAEIDSLDAKGRYAALSRTSETFPAHRNRSKEIGGNDELIGSLANAYENLRARQVSEWEQLRRRAVGRTAW